MKKIVLLLLIFAPMSSFSHPHMFMDTQVEFTLDENGVEGFTITWIFDNMFSSSIIADFDLDHDKKFSKKEIADLQENAFSNLKNYSYFVIVYDGKQVYKPSAVSNFQPSLQGDRVVYKFFVPFKTKVNDKKKLRLQVFDETFFCDIRYVEKNPVTFAQTGNYLVQSAIRENKEAAIEYDNTTQTASREGESYSGYASPYEIFIEIDRKAK